jgi:predicted Zn finger-like uncharacterized protein
MLWITCPACQAVINSKTALPAGKEIQCPKCGKAFAAPGQDPVKADNGKKGKDQRKLMVIAGAAGGLVLLTCCCVGMFGGGWWWFSNKGNKSAIVGVWRSEFLEYEFRSDGKLKTRNFTNQQLPPLDLVYKFVETNVIEIKGDSSGNNTLNGQPYPTIRMNVTVVGDELTLRELSPDPDPNGVKFKRSSK